MFLKYPYQLYFDIIIGQTDLWRESYQGNYFVDKLYVILKKNPTSLFNFEDGPLSIFSLLLLQYAIGKVPGTCFFILFNEIACVLFIVAHPESGAFLTSRSDPGYFFAGSRMQPMSLVSML
jgi:hypothetical protein